MFLQAVAFDICCQKNYRSKWVGLKKINEQKETGCLKNIESPLLKIYCPFGLIYLMKNENFEPFLLFTVLCLSKVREKLQYCHHYSTCKLPNFLRFSKNIILIVTGLFFIDQSDSTVN